MRNTALSTVLVLTFIFVAAPAQGSTIDVRVLSAKFSATMTVAWGDNTLPQTKTTTSPYPVSDFLDQGFCEDDFGNISLCDGGWPSGFASAAAGFLDVEAIGLASHFATDIAEADTELTFSPFVDGVAYIDIVGDNSFIESWQSASLFDLTANEQVWRFFAIRYDFGIQETVPTFLDADHVYVMHLNAFAAGRGDGTFSTLRVSNLHVPDNVDSFMCLCIGLLVALIGKWKLGT